MMMRAVLDTNVILSGLLWRGAPHTLLELARSGTLTLISSPTLLAELAEVVSRPKFDLILARSNTSREHLLAQVQELAELVVPEPLPQPVCRDPDDDHVLACALAAAADLVISGDRDLLALGTFQTIRILAPSSAALVVLAEAAPESSS